MILPDDDNQSILNLFRYSKDDGNTKKHIESAKDSKVVDENGNWYYETAGIVCTVNLYYYKKYI